MISPDAEEEKGSIKWDIVQTDLAMWTSVDDSPDGFERLNDYKILEILGRGKYEVAESFC